MGEGFAACCVFIVLYTFLSATFNGVRTGNYTVVINTNAVGEHYFELILILFCTLLYVYSIYKRYKGWEI